jgi:hypothetical protein
VRDDDIEDLASRLEASLGELVRETRLRLRVRLVGGRLAPFAGGPVARIELNAMAEYERRGAHLFRPGRLIGVEAQNRGTVGADVQAAGIDVDHGPDQPHPSRCACVPNDITGWQFPCRVDGHETRIWFETEDRIRGFSDGLYRTHGLVPQRFRGWVELGHGDRLCGEWIARADLPIWEPGVGEQHLRARFNEPR